MRRLATFTTGFAVLAFAVLEGAVPAAASNVLEVPVAFPTIQAAINAAVNGDTVLVDPGTYVENIDFKGKLITVQSAKGPSVTTIDGGNVAPVVNFSTSETAAAVLQGFTIQHGNATGTYGYEGAGVHISGASPTVEGNVITANVSCASGTGIGISSASPVIRDNTITGNSKQSGCSGQGGGGIDVGGAGSAQIIHNTITNNSSDFGGGIDLFAAGTPTLLNNTISNNTAGIQGGGIYAVNQSDAMIVQNLITGNTSAQSGGAVYISPPSGTRGAFLVNNTFANNVGSDSSLWLGGFDSQVQLSNNIVSANNSLPAVLCDTTYSTTPPVLDHNDLFNAGGPAVQGSCGSVIGSSGNISADPKFVSSTDFHLQATSPAVDAGNNAAPSLPATDFDGFPRINGTVVDLGAYELQRPLVLAAGSPISAVEGAAFTATLGQFTGGTGPFSATVAWGDGQTGPATISGGTISGGHTYAEEGSDTVTVTVTDSTAATASATISATLTDAALTMTAGVNVTGAEGSTVTVGASFSDANPLASTADFTASIAWGDQRTSTGTVATGAGSTFTVSASHTYAEEGTYTVTVTVTDDGGASASTTIAASISDAALSATGRQLSEHHDTTFTATIATLSDADPGGVATDYSGLINWGDGTMTSCPSVSCGIVRQSNGTFSISASHRFHKNGKFTVTIQVADAGGATVNTTTTISVG